MNITLTAAQRSQILKALEPFRDESGEFETEIELGNLTIVAQGEVEIEGYTEGGYNGTGAFIETDRYATVELKAYDPDGNELKLDSKEETAALNYLYAA